MWSPLVETTRTVMQRVVGRSGNGNRQGTYTPGTHSNNPLSILFYQIFRWIDNPLCFLYKKHLIWYFFHIFAPLAGQHLTNWSYANKESQTFPLRCLSDSHAERTKILDVCEQKIGNFGRKINFCPIIEIKRKGESLIKRESLSCIPGLRLKGIYFIVKNHPVW